MKVRIVSIGIAVITVAAIVVAVARSEFAGSPQGARTQNLADVGTRSQTAPIRDESSQQPALPVLERESVPSPELTTTSAKPAMNQVRENSFDSDDKFDGKRIVRSDAEWKSLLNPKQFDILRNRGTEEPFTGEYNDFKGKGTYHCAACNLKLFGSKDKFDSGTGWPSFFQVYAKQNIDEEVDTELNEVRTEVLCARCRSHLGHVFDDGPKPTGLRYCINSVALKFRPAK